MEDAISDGGYMIPNTHNFPLMIRDVMNITSLSRGNIYTLEKAGGFPRRLSTHSAWGSDSIRLWMQDLLDTRNALPAPFHVSTITLEDRFLRTSDVRRLAPRHCETCRHYEDEGRFPKRLIIGKGRHAWIEREIKLWFASLKDPRTKHLKLKKLT